MVSCSAKVVGYDVGAVGCGVGAIGYGAGVVRATANELPIITDELLSSPRFGGGKRGGADEVVSAGDDDLDIDEDVPCAPPTPAALAYSTVKSWCATADLSSTACPMPSLAFIEYDVMRYPHTLCHRVEHMIGLSPLSVADEDSRRATIVELADVVQLLDEGEVAEDTQVADCWLAPVPGLI